jgi:ribonuclease J
MENNIEISLNSGYIKHREIFVTPEEANNLSPNEVCLLCTGSQGEPLAALSRIANNSHRQIKLQDDDVVIFSSSAIPGNALSISRIINKLYLQGVKVYTNTSLNDVHTSGHGNKEELKLMLRLIKPEYFMPMHGEYRMLKEHAELAVDCDVPRENIFIMENGNSLILDNNGVHRGPDVQAGDIYVDGSRIGEVGSVVIKDRKLMSRDGILITILNINPLTRKLLIKPNITTRGFVLVNENAELIAQIENRTTDIVTKFLSENPYSYTDLKNQIILELHPFINELTGRRPIVLPVIMEVKEGSNYD